MYLQYRNFGYGYSARCKEHEGKHDYEEHIHQFLEVLCVLNGSLEVTVNGVVQVAKEGDLAVILPFHSHSYHTPEYCKIWVGLMSGDWVEDFISSGEFLVNSNAVFTPSRTVFDYIVEKLPQPHNIRTLSDMSKVEFQNNKALYYAVMNEYMQKNDLSSVGSSTHPLAALYSYVYNHFKEPITLKQTAAAIGYTSTYLSHCISAIPGNSFRNIVNSARIEYAKKLLSSTDMKIIDIALESGFTSESLFYTAFEKIVKMTPRNYRSNQKGMMRVHSLSLIP